MHIGYTCKVCKTGYSLTSTTSGFCTLASVSAATQDLTNAAISAAASALNASTGGLFGSALTLAGLGVASSKVASILRLSFISFIALIGLLYF